MYQVSNSRIYYVAFIIISSLPSSVFSFTYIHNNNNNAFYKKKILILPFFHHIQKTNRYYKTSVVAKKKTTSLSSSTTLDPENDDDEERWLMSPLNNIVECFLPIPNPGIKFNEVVTICLTSLQQNNEPYRNAGLEVCFNFSSDRTRAALGGDLIQFINNAQNPTFGSLIQLIEWNVLSTGPEIPGTNTRGAMRTVLTNVAPKEGREKRFLWTLQKERRPPNTGCWLIYEVLFTDNAYELTL